MVAIADGGDPIRSTMTHVRTQTEKSSAGWSGDELVRFIEEHASIAAAASVAGPHGRAGRRHGHRRGQPGHRAGAATDNLGGVPELEYQATLSGRPFGKDGERSTWATLARQAGRVSVSDRLPLRFTAVALPPGLQRLRVEVTLRLPEPSEDGPKLAIAGR